MHYSLRLKTVINIFSLQFDAIKQYIDNGGNVIVMMSEGGENSFKTNINFLLEDYGVMVNSGLWIKYFSKYFCKFVYIVTDCISFFSGSQQKCLEDT